MRRCKRDQRLLTVCLYHYPADVLGRGGKFHTLLGEVYVGGGQRLLGGLVQE